MAVSAVIGLGSLALGAARYFSANSAAKKDKARADSLRRPFLKVQDEYYQDRNTAAALATSGLPIDVTNKLSRERSQGLATSLSALRETAGGPNAFANLNKSFSDSLLNESAVNAQQELKNIEYFMTVNKDLAGQKTTSWGINELQPYQNNLKQANQAQAADLTNRNNALNETVESASSLATSFSNSGLLNKLFPGGNGGVSEPYSSTASDVQPVTTPGTINTSRSLPPITPLNLNTPINADAN